MCASTPTGRRGKFYQICHDPLNQNVPMDEDNQYDESKYDRETAEGWKEFYFPTMANPEWSPKMEKELRGLYTQAAYEHEVLAEFGTELAGVFNKDFVDEASSIGYPLVSQPTIDAPISIGVDWDKFGNATQIIVTQWDPLDERRPRPDIDGPGTIRYGRFKILNRIEIPSGEFTYDNAVRKLIELDKIYNPFAIYPDRGAGDKLII